MKNFYPKMADTANAKLLALLADSDADDSDGDDGGDGAINRDLEQLDSILKDPLSNVVSELKRRRRRSKVDAKRKTYRLHGGKLNADMEHAMGEANMAFAMGEYAKAEASLKQASGGNAALCYPRPQSQWRVRVCVPNHLVGASLASCVGRGRALEEGLARSAGLLLNGMVRSSCTQSTTGISELFHDTQVVSGIPNYAPAWTLLGVIYTELGEKEKVRAQLFPYRTLGVNAKEPAAGSYASMTMINTPSCMRLAPCFRCRP
jgi:hypothetical protein